jgi:hypothetical protein
MRFPSQRPEHLNGITCHGQTVGSCLLTNVSSSDTSITVFHRPNCLICTGLTVSRRDRALKRLRHQRDALKAAAGCKQRYIGCETRAGITARGGHPYPVYCSSVTASSHVTWEPSSGMFFR